MTKRLNSIIGNIHKDQSIVSFFRTSLCLQQRLHAEIRSSTKTTFSHVKKKLGVALPSFPEVLKRRNMASFIPRFEPHELLCVVFFGDKGLFCCTYECGGFETVSISRMGQNIPGTLPCRDGRIPKKT